MYIVRVVTYVVAGDGGGWVGPDLGKSNLFEALMETEEMERYMTLYCRYLHNLNGAHNLLKYIYLCK